MNEWKKEGATTQERKCIQQSVCKKESVRLWLDNGQAVQRKAKVGSKNGTAPISILSQKRWTMCNINPNVLPKIYQNKYCSNIGIVLLFEQARQTWE